MDVSVIIVNYNTRKLTGECIDSIFEKTSGITFEVIVVDNASQDDSIEIFRKDPRIIFIENTENQGFEKANNLGIKYATGRNILFLNSDTLLINNALKILSDYLDNNSDVGACGGNLYGEDRKPIVSFEQNRPSIYGYIDNIFLNGISRLRFGHSIKFNYGNKPLQVSYITGADLIIPRKILEKVGGFDPTFFMYYEEIELCCRIVKAGYKIMSVPTAKIVHLVGRSCCINDWGLKVREQSRRIYLKRTLSPIKARIANWLYYLLINTRIIEHWIAGNNGKTAQWITTRKLFWKKDDEIFQ